MISAGGATAPRFSVVIPAHNRERTIGQTLASVRLQTEADWEAVVVDDGSTDGTATVVERIGDPRIRLVRQTNAGAASARNAGIRLARGRFVSFLDSDDLWLPDYLASVSAVFERAPEASVVYTDLWVLDDQTGRIRTTSAAHYQRPPVPPPESARAFLLELLQRSFIGVTTTVRREAIDAVGGFDERLATAEDWEWELRIAAAGHRFARVDRRVAVRRDHDGSLGRDVRRNLENECEVYRIIAEEWETTDELRTRARELSADRRRRIAQASRQARFRDLTPVAIARKVKRALNKGRLWYSEPPEELRSLLAAVKRLEQAESGLPGSPSGA